jgi:hypothetical protein
VVATGDVARAVLRRFDLLTEVLGLDRQRATGWTLSRVLQNALWDIEDGETALDPAQITIATTLPASSSAHQTAHLIAGNADRASQRTLMPLSVRGCRRKPCCGGRVDLSEDHTATRRA